MGVPKTYEREAEKLAKAIDIAIEAFEKHKPSNFSDDHVALVISSYTTFRLEALYPEPEFKKISSLKHIVSAAFSYFQEGAGDTVEYFWKRLHEENLNYKRENRLEKILTRGKIKDRVEYEYVIDLLVPAQQSGYISKEQAENLNKMIAAFERHRPTGSY